MQNEYANRQNMHLTVLTLLGTTEFQPVWKNKKPAAFTARAAEFEAKVGALAALISSQQADTTGYAEDKAREELELESAAHEIGQALAGWFEDQGRMADAAQVDLSLSAWQRLRDTELVAKARLLHQKLTDAIAADAAALADYGLDATDAAALAKETADFEAIIANPAAAISSRRALTLSLRPKFREVGELLAKMDRLVLRFRSDEAGNRFAEAWQAARTIRDLGQAAPATPTSPTPPTA
jgi:hypothetical protein